MEEREKRGNWEEIEKSRRRNLDNGEKGRKSENED